MTFTCERTIPYGPGLTFGEKVGPYRRAIRIAKQKQRDALASYRGRYPYFDKTAALTPVMKQALIGAGSGALISGGLTTAKQLGRVHAGEYGQHRVNPYMIARNTLLGAGMGAGISQAPRGIASVKGAYAKSGIREGANSILGTIKNVEGITGKVRDRSVAGLLFNPFKFR